VQHHLLVPVCGGPDRPDMGRLGLETQVHHAGRLTNEGLPGLGHRPVVGREHQAIRCVEYYAHQVVCDRPRLRMILPDVRGSA
jgi:hypothetical protein